MSFTMVNWKDPNEIAAEGIAFTKVIYVLFGIYIWEICTTGSFEMSIFFGKRQLAWPLIFFFMCRYGMLFAFTGLIISFNVFTRVNCNALYTFISVAGNLTIISASTSLMIRTMALWEWKRWAILSMLALSIGQWTILIRTMMVVQASWDDKTGACIIVNTNHVLLNLNYVYTMSFDFVILLMTIFALGKHSRHQGLSGLLFRDGLVYFLITSICNTIPAVLAILNFNDQMNVVATVPAAAVSAIAACRAVIRLKAFNNSNGENTNTSSLSNRISTALFTSRSPRSTPGHRVNFLSSHKTTQPEIDVAKDTIAMDEIGSSQNVKSKSQCDHERHSCISTDFKLDSKNATQYGDRRPTTQISSHICFGSAV